MTDDPLARLEREYESKLALLCELDWWQAVLLDESEEVVDHTRLAVAINNASWYIWYLQRRAGFWYMLSGVLSLVVIGLTVVLVVLVGH